MYTKITKSGCKELSHARDILRSFESACSHHWLRNYNKRKPSQTKLNRKKNLPQEHALNYLLKGGAVLSSLIIFNPEPLSALFTSTFCIPGTLSINP